MAPVSWDEADPMTSSALVAVGEYGEPPARQVAALRAAIEVLCAAEDLEARLEEKGEYIITSMTMTKVRDRV